MYKVDVTFLEVGDRAGVERYAIARGLVRADQRPIAVARAGDGNMNVTLRLMPASGAPIVLKQARPWVAKYEHIPAPFERTLVEAAFYAAVQADPFVADRMPSVLAVDRENHVLALEDVGGAGDFTTIYDGAAMPAATLAELLEWLERLAAVTIGEEQRLVLANREMRELNHEHMFKFPLAADNGLELDAVTPGLQEAASALIVDRAYCAAVETLGKRYLADGETLVHGDYFPGSWMQTDDGVRVIDPEFCFPGDAEFDIGILTGHLVLAASASTSVSLLGMVSASVERRRLDAARVAGYAGVEIMRRLIGVAQLPLNHDLDRKRALLQRSRTLLLQPDKGIA